MIMVFRHVGLYSPRNIESNSGLATAKWLGVRWSGRQATREWGVVRM